MPNLTPSTPPQRSNRPQQAASITRVVVVRDDGPAGAKHVRHNEEPSRFGARTGFWSAIGLGTVAFLWLTGHFGETLGFATSLGLDDLVSSNDHGLAAGVRVVLGVPLRIFEMTMVDPFRFVAACALIAIPAAGLAVAAPRVPGGPSPSKLAGGFSWMGVVVGTLVFAGLIAWIAWPGRRATLGIAPLDRAAFGGWLADARAVAGFDALAFVAGILWLVLLFRMPLPRLAVRLAAPLGFVASFAAWTGFTVSNGVVDGCTHQRPVIVTLANVSADDAAPLPRSLLLGTLHGRSTVMGAGERPAPMALGVPEFFVNDRSSLEAWMRPLSDGG